MMMKKKTTLLLILILALLFSTMVGAKVDNWVLANLYPYTNCDSSFVTVSIVSPENKTYDTNIILLTVTVGAYPGVWYVSYSVDGKPFKEVAFEHLLGHTFKENVQLSALSKGSHSIVVEAAAMANNPEGKVTTQAQVYFTVTKEIESLYIIAPEIILFSPQNKTYYKTGIPLNFSVNEPDCSISYKFDEQDTIKISHNTTLTGFYYGSHRITIYAIDATGNSGVQTVVFTLARPNGFTPSSEYFPTRLVITSVITIAVMGIGLFVYFKKRKNQARE